MNCIVYRFVYRSRKRKLLNTLCLYVYLSILKYYPTGSVQTSKHFYLFAESADVLLDYNINVTDNRFQWIVLEGLTTVATRIIKCSDYGKEYLYYIHIANFSCNLHLNQILGYKQIDLGINCPPFPRIRTMQIDLPGGYVVSWKIHLQPNGIKNLTSCFKIHFFPQKYWLYKYLCLIALDRIFIS